MFFILAIMTKKDMKKYRVLLSVHVTPTALHMDTVSVNSVCSYLAPTALHLDTMSVN